MIRARIERPAANRALVLGFLLTALVIASLLLTAKPAHAEKTFIVSNANDSGAGSLRQAITDANATSGLDRIEFNIPGSGVKTIRPVSRLPQITDAVTIDGYSQPEAKPNSRSSGGTDAVLLVELNGTGVTSGLFIEADDVVVRGLVINRFSESHIIVRGSNNRIEGNFIGPDATGTQDLGGGDDGGVSVSSRSGNINTIGGTSPGARNLISGNDRAGVFLSGSEGNRVEGNLIGTSKDGTSPLGNGAGVTIFSSSDNTVGGAVPGAANTLAFNSSDGVVIGGAGTGNRFLSNSIFSNVEEGIDLGADGPTANDPGDADTGENDRQNYPEISSAFTFGVATSVLWTLNSQADSAFTLQFFSNPPGEDEGKTFLGQTIATTDGAGNASFSFVSPTGSAAGDLITATATSADGDTSEFSEPVEAKQQSLPPKMKKKKKRR